ncbi:MAG: HepT-like ribonuclease domain-containing protein [Dongiaceae bacterium]
MAQQIVKTRPLTRDEAMRVLTEHEQEIRAQGVTRLALFGSTLRNEARIDSDVDVLVDYDKSKVRSLLDIAGIRLLLCELLGREVELAERGRLKRFLKDNILAEAVEVFPRPGYRHPMPKGTPMPPRSPRQRLHDIRDSILFIEEHVAGRGFPDYLADKLLRGAIERNIEIISEASRRLPEDLTNAHPHIPWAKIRGVGNILRHDYDEVYDEVIWAIAKQHVTPLRQAIEAMIAEVDRREGR